jgi:hypothetical protein
MATPTAYSLFKLLMQIKQFSTICACLLLCTLVACGNTASNAEQVANQQFALAATAAADGDTVRQLVATSAALTAVAPSETPVPTRKPTVAPSATAVPATATTDTVAIQARETAAAQAAATELAAVATPTIVPSASSVPTTARADTVTSVPTAVPPTIAPPTAIPATPVPPTAEPVSALPPGGEPYRIEFWELYSGASVAGPILSDKAKALNGYKVQMFGHMAPPLKPALDFFVLTKDPMVYCPFCSTASDWPFDIVFVRMANGQIVDSIVPTHPIMVTGTFSVGPATDAETGFVSMVRIYADSVVMLEQ